MIGVGEANMTTQRKHTAAYLKLKSPWKCSRHTERSRQIASEHAVHPTTSLFEEATSTSCRAIFSDKGHVNKRAGAAIGSNSRSGTRSGLTGLSHASSVAEAPADRAGTPRTEHRAAMPTLGLSCSGWCLPAAGEPQETWCRCLIDEQYTSPIIHESC